MRYRIEICEDTEAEEGYVVCLYDNEGNGEPIEDYYGILDISYPALGELFHEALTDLGVTLDDCEIVRDY
jgi:hypothetical protein